MKEEWLKETDNIEILRRVNKWIEEYIERRDEEAKKDQYNKRREEERGKAMWDQKGSLVKLIEQGTSGAKAQRIQSL